MGRFSRLRSMLGMGKESDPDPVASSPGGGGTNEVKIEEPSVAESKDPPKMTVKLAPESSLPVDGDELGIQVAPVEGDRVVKVDGLTWKQGVAEDDEVGIKVAPAEGDEVGIKVAPDDEAGFKENPGSGEEIDKDLPGKAEVVQKGLKVAPDDEVGIKVAPEDTDDVEIGVGELQDAPDHLDYEPVEGSGLDGDDLTTVEDVADKPFSTPVEDVSTIAGSDTVVTPAPAPDPGPLDVAPSPVPDPDPSADDESLDTESFIGSLFDAPAEPTAMVPLEEASPEELRTAAAEIEESADLDLDLDDLGGGGGEDLLDQ